MLDNTSPNTLERIAMETIPSDRQFEVTDTCAEVYCAPMDNDDILDFHCIGAGSAHELGRDVLANYISELSRISDLEVGEVLWDVWDMWIVKRVK